MDENKVTPKMEYWGWVLSLIATLITIVWISYNAIKEYKRRHKIKL